MVINVFDILTLTLSHKSDINECDFDICGTNMDKCDNIPGGFVCTCKPGFKGKLCDEGSDS